MLRVGQRFIAADAHKMVVTWSRTIGPLTRRIDISPDGRHILNARGATDESKMIVVENWRTEARRKLRQVRR